MNLDEMTELLITRKGYASERAIKLSQIEGFKKTIALLEKEAAYLDQKISDVEHRIKR